MGLDTSCLVPLLADEHTFHEITRTEWERLKRQDVKFVVACHALLEAFAVLTRMPPPFRRAPEEVERLLRENFGDDADIPPVAEDMVWSAMRDLVAQRVSSGAIYDAVIARSTLAAGAAVLLTWNPKDFLRVAPAGLEITTPEEYRTWRARVH